MVSTNYNYVATPSRGKRVEEMIVKLLRSIAWRSSVENVTCNNKRLDLLVGDLVGEPFEESRELMVSFSAIQGAADVPVGGVENFHKE